MPKQKTQIIIKAVTPGKKEKTTLLRVLKLARSIVAGEVAGTKWKKQVWIDTEEEKGVSLACFCAEGAIQAAARGVKLDPRQNTHTWARPVQDVEERAKEALSYALPGKWKGEDVPGWNDQKGRQRRHVVAAFDKAIQSVEDAA